MVGGTSSSVKVALPNVDQRLSKPGKFVMTDNGWQETKTFGDRKDREGSESVPVRAVVTDRGNVVIFDLLEKTVRKGPTGNEALLYDNVADSVSEELYSMLSNYSSKPPIVLNKQFDSLRNAAELIKHLPYPETYGIASGRKPSGPCHFGHKLVIETLSFFQKNGAQIFVPIADNEAGLDSKIQNAAQYKYFAADNLLDWGASGLNLDAAHVYLQSEEIRVMNISYAVARNLDMQLTIDIYGRETFVDQMNFLFASLTQVGDILLPQHPDFGKAHSFMLSGADQDGNMAMTTALSRRMSEHLITAGSHSMNYIKTIPSSLYVRSVANFEGKKESASETDTTIYLGPSRNLYQKTELGGKILADIRRLSLSDRITDTMEKIDRFEALDRKKVMAAVMRRQPLFKEFEHNKELDLDKFKCITADIIEVHLEKRRIVYEYALLRTLTDIKIGRQGNNKIIEDLITAGKQNVPGFDENKRPVPPSFWQVPEAAIVPEEKKKTATKWYQIVSNAAENLVV